MALIKSSVIPNFLRAESPEQLRVAMFLNNVRMGAYVNYFDIQKDGNTWIAWFYEELTDAKTIQLANQPKRLRRG